MFLIHTFVLFEVPVGHMEKCGPKSDSWRDLYTSVSKVKGEEQGLIEHPIIPGLESSKAFSGH